MTIKTFSHSGKLGDIIWSLPFIRFLGGGNLYLKINQYDQGSNEIKLTQETADSILSLLRCQPYLNDVQIYNGESIDYDLDKFRTKIFQVKTSIAGSFFHAFDLGHIDFEHELDIPWLEVEPDLQFKNKIVISRTSRYLTGNPEVNPFYIFLRDRNISRHGVFLGTEKEHRKFQELHDISIEWHQTETVLEAARIIAASKFYVGNENLINAINESLKKTSFLENQKNFASHFCLFNRPDLFII